MENERIDRIKKHFEEAAEKYDIVIQKLIPHYNQMVEALVSVIPFSKENGFSAIDLGCGTGTISQSVKNEFPNITITCVDISANMLEIARNKIGGNITCIQADFNSFVFLQKYDLIISSLALHHLENDDEKLEFYKKIYSSINRGGVFINIDVVLGNDDFIQEQYMKKWREFLEEKLSSEETEKCMSDYYAEDRPTKLITHLDMLRECGFTNIDVIYKIFNFAVYAAMKNEK